MRLVSYLADSQGRLGVIEGEHVVDVNAALKVAGQSGAPHAGLEAEAVRDFGVASVTDMVDLLSRGPEFLRALGALCGSLAKAIRDKDGLPGLFLPVDSTRLLAPIARPAKIVCLGLNYADHAREQGIEPPAAPLYFLKSVNTVCGPGDPIRLPPNSSQVDYEAEMAVVIGQGGRRIPVESAAEHIAGYMILHDVSARDLQFSDKQWFRGKSCDTFAPCGPWIVTPGEVGDPHALRISLTLNGQTMQDSNTSNLIFGVERLVSDLSQSLTWEAGDLISTGTPPGVGVFRKPPVFLKSGDLVSITVERLGTLTNPVVVPGEM